MSELLENDSQLSFQRLGVQYQLKLLAELFIPNNINKKTKHLFVDEVINYIDPNYFEQQDMRQLLVLFKDYKKEYSTPPNLDNIYTIINQKITNEINKNELISRLSQIKKIIKDRKDGLINDDSQPIKDNTLMFVKQQEMLKGIKHAEEKLAKGIASRSTIEEISGLFKKINNIGEVKLSGKRLFEDDDDIFSEDNVTKFKTGFEALDRVFEPYGAFDRGEIFVWVAPSGTFKSTGLCITGYENMINGFNVLHLVAEGKEKHIRAKYYAKLTGIPITELPKQKELAKKRIEIFKQRPNVGTLKVIRVEDGITTSQIRNIVNRENEKLPNGQKIDLIIFDYFEGLGADKGVNGQVYQNQTTAILEMENYINEDGADMGFATACQTKKEGMNMDIIYGDQMAGSLALLKKSSCVVSVSKVNNVAVVKGRHLGAGTVFEGCEIDKNILTIKKNDGDYVINETIIEKGKEFEETTDDEGNQVFNKVKGLNLNE